jgi:PAS domain-containing protein
VEPVGRQRNPVLILARSFAAQLATAVFLVDAEGTVIYFNEAAERLLGQQFVEGAGMAAEEWSTRYRPRDSEGHTVPLESLPLGVTMLKRKSAHGILTILGADGVDRRIEVAAFPARNVKGNPDDEETKAFSSRRSPRLPVSLRREKNPPENLSAVG